MGVPAPEANDDLTETHIIHVEEAETQVDLHLDDMIAFAVFWGMAGVVFLQFFSRYILNDSAAWTEEIARYMLMWLTFIGAAIVTRRGTHIGVEVLLHMLPEASRRGLRFLIDVVTLGFIALLCWFSVMITERMGIQRMTVIDVSMSVVYAGIAFGCFLMLWRAVQVFIANARRGWRPDPHATTLILD
ncbi:MAG: TRAP transporter small permease [Hyphomicrobiales bacterium]|uniref:TRAP transporter small permease n=1 Tax=Rhabdaerophilum calidifontis TaxID=2604328 RepID=UPI00123C09AE|nr:TRAP transporter small permease [Rhabdaerophilum calidifontis]MCA1952186.1 TRAP transporter small permease [Hyphomicrobiales bacterium]MCA1998852.1 TRAP transporter small permease [Hyphomicrobiales bacterium]